MSDYTFCEGDQVPVVDDDGYIYIPEYVSFDDLSKKIKEDIFDCIDDEDYIAFGLYFFGVYNKYRNKADIDSFEFRLQLGDTKNIDNSLVFVQFNEVDFFLYAPLPVKAGLVKEAFSKLKVSEPLYVDIDPLITGYLIVKDNTETPIKHYYNKLNINEINNKSFSKNEIHSIILTYRKI